MFTKHHGYIIKKAKITTKMKATPQPVIKAYLCQTFLTSVNEARVGKLRVPPLLAGWR